MTSNRKLRILLIHPHDIFAVSEPWTIRIKKIASELKKFGHDVSIAYFPLPEEERGGIVTESIKGIKTIPLSRSKWSILPNMLKMKKLCKDVDIIHLQKPFFYAALPAIYASQNRNIPLHYDWDDWEKAIYDFGNPSPMMGKYLDFLERKVPLFADTFSAASKELEKLFLKMGLNKDRIVQTPVGADLDRFRPRKKDKDILKKHGIKKNKVVLYLGQLHGAQYAELLIRSAEIILEKSEPIKFLIVGGGHDLPRLQGIIERKKLDKDIITTGFVEDSDVQRYMSVADVAIACFENNDITRCKSPLKIAEYLASGKAIVASDVGEVSRMVGDAGILTKPGDPQDMADAILDMLSDEKRRKKFEKNARKRAETVYNWQSTATNLLKAYYIALDDR